ncbi:MAG: hypothetical protein KBT87_07780 [Gammaproteobacteria bacterium]|nr:hypothetical protein [Gammaproteobacteria bacterium]MBQ0774552.1 hypothetical protein [Gammaproteobacteria bacterium]
MANISENLAKLMEIDGAVGVSLVDSNSGMVLGAAGGGVDMELAAAGNSEVVKAKMKTMKSLGIKGEIEDILITLETQYHILRPMIKQKGLFLYIVLDKAKANLALARRNVQNIESSLEV